jgi:DNA-binding NtrC family response regulator
MTTGSGTAGKVNEKVVWASGSDLVGREILEALREQESVDVDIRCAARSKAPVLITGPAQTAESIALEIHRRGPGRRSAFTVVDCETPERLRSALEHGEAEEGGTLLLRGVHRLTPPMQALLSEALRQPGRRIVATTPIALERRVGQFDETLFYRLNVIHIDLGSEH